jgi:iron(III) transport system substrate-binding protein
VHKVVWGPERKTVRQSRVGGLATVITAASLAVAAVAISAAGSAASERPHSSGPTLVVYSAQGYDSAEVTAFEKAYPSIKVSLDDDSTGPLLLKVEAEKNNPKWGLLWVDGATAFASLDQQGLLLKGWEPNVSWNTLGKEAVPSDKSYVPTGLTTMAALAYEPTKLPDPPTTWNALLNSKYNGEVGMNDPAVSGPTFPFVAGIMSYLGGVTAGENFFTDLNNNGLVINLTNGNTLAALEAGIIKMGLIQSSAAIGADLKTNGLVKVKFLSPQTALPSAIGIDKDAPKAEQLEAEKFVDFVLSAQGQKVMQSGDPTGDSLYWPVLNGVKPLSALPALSTLHVQNIDPYTWGSKENAINTWFTDNIVE